MLCTSCNHYLKMAFLKDETGGEKEKHTHKLSMPKTAYWATGKHTIVLNTLIAVVQHKTL